MEGAPRGAPSRVAGMRFGIATPVVVRVAGSHADWEADAGIGELAEIARAADRLGYHHLTCSEHVGVPQSVAATRGVTYWDPLATLGYMAAVTERIRFVTNVLVLGYHHPLEIAKRYGTLDVVCGGRLILGFGVGSLQEEVKAMLAAVDPPAGFDVVLSSERRTNPLGDPDGTRRAIEAVGALGATIMAVTVVNDSLPHYLEQIEAFQQVAAGVTSAD